ncbi:MAG TPA: NAD(P)/FAD-dependent oxidoreductase [Verrucomicrobiae bacterium]|nr:NAD(P)/FAD-dependent oxidoreductase [Verrucomicrobiae bacterium]
MKDLIVIGGGITGLAAAYLAAKAGRQVTVLEGAEKMGGLLGTFSVGGNRLEHFYHHAFTHDVELLWLLRELGIEDRMQFLSSTMGVYCGGHNYPFNSPADLLRFKPMGFADKLRFGLTSLYLARVANWRERENVPAMEWFYRRAGQRATDALWAPLLRVKFGPYAEQVPLTWMIGRMRQRINSRQAGQEKLGYMQGSLDVLLQALLRALEKAGVKLRCGVRVEGLNVENGEVKSVRTTAGEFTADAFLFTIPTTHLSELVQPVAETYAAQLRQIEYFGAVCTVLELKRPLSSTYWLNVADPGFPFGGIIEHTNLVSPQEYQGRHLVYLSRYFAASDPLAQMSAPATEKLMLDGLKRVYPGLTDSDLVKVHVFSSRTAAVVCDLNFSKKIPACRAPLKRMYLATMAHVYPDERSCNNSVRVAAEACRVMGLEILEIPKHASLSGQIGMK